MSVDGKMNFAESSNVILKNSSILSLFAAAGRDPIFWHPRFCLFDNVEDKGMQDERSHNFQEIIAKVSSHMTLPHQIIFTTSMPSASLETDAITVGPYYTPENRTLNFGDTNPSENRADSEL